MAALKAIDKIRNISVFPCKLNHQSFKGAFSTRHNEIFITTENLLDGVIMIIQRYEKGSVAMITIRPVSDLRNRFTEIEKTVKEGTPVYLTKNGYGTMVVMSLEH